MSINMALLAEATGFHLVSINMALLTEGRLIPLGVYKHGPPGGGPLD